MVLGNVKWIKTNYNLTVLTVVLILVTYCANISIGLTTTLPSKNGKDTSSRFKNSRSHRGFCGAISPDCFCRRKKSKRESLTCQKTNCIHRLPTNKISHREAINFISVVIVRWEMTTFCETQTQIHCIIYGWNIINNFPYICWPSLYLNLKRKQLKNNGRFFVVCMQISQARWLERFYDKH